MSGATERERTIGAIRRDHWALANDEIDALADALIEARIADLTDPDTDPDG